MRLRIKNFNICYGGSQKNLIFRGEGGFKKPVCIGEFPKKGDLDSFHI